MFFSILISLASTLASPALVNAAGYATREPQLPACTGFDTISNKTVLLPSEDIIISTGVVCNVSSASNLSTSCSVLSGGWPEPPNVIMHTNGTKITKAYYAVGYALWDATGDSNALYGGYGVAVENQTVTFDDGTSGWVIFTPSYRCVRGRVQGCQIDAGIANDTAVDACYPELTGDVVSFESLAGHFENISVLAGDRSINETSAREAAALKRNPSNNPPYGLSSSDAQEAMVRVGSTVFLALPGVWLMIWAL